MAKNSAIEWTHHTFNPWWGCTKVSPACKNCYAESWAKRVGVNVWGSRTDRRFFSEKHWVEPFRWNREAEAQKIRRRNSTVGGQEVARIDAISSESAICFLRTLTWSNRSYALASTCDFRTRTELGNRRRREWRKVAANEPSVG